MWHFRTEQIPYLEDLFNDENFVSSSTQNKLQRLHAMFPHTDKSLIRDVLQLEKYNLNNAIEKLLELTKGNSRNNSGDGRTANANESANLSVEQTEARRLASRDNEELLLIQRRQAEEEAHKLATQQREQALQYSILARANLTRKHQLANRMRFNELARQHREEEALHQRAKAGHKKATSPRSGTTSPRRHQHHHKRDEATSGSRDSAHKKRDHKRPRASDEPDAPPDSAPKRTDVLVTSSFSPPTTTPDASSTTTVEYGQAKGLQNRTGEMNCFLNVCIQSLYHLPVFRIALAAASSSRHQCLWILRRRFFNDSATGSESCIICGLQSIFDQFTYGDTSAAEPLPSTSSSSLVGSFVRSKSFEALASLVGVGFGADGSSDDGSVVNAQAAAVPPTALRSALAALYAPAGKFALREIDDAVEALDAILSQIHYAATRSSSNAAADVVESAATANDDRCCVAHRVFGQRMQERAVCTRCGHAAEPQFHGQFVHYVSATALRHAMEQATGATFERVLRELANTTMFRCEKEACRQIGFLQQRLLNAPDVMTLGLVWDSGSCSKEEIYAVMSRVHTSFDITHALGASSTLRQHTSTLYVLRGTLAYYGQHYVAFARNPSDETWTAFDDHTVRKLNTDFASVVATVSRARLQPLLLFYEKAQ